MTRRPRWGPRAIGSAIEVSQAAWQHQYGSLWLEFARRKHRFDHDNILTPEPGIFG